MRLIKQQKKIYLYDEYNDKYIPVEPDDLDHILDEDNNLLSDDAIYKYYKFKRDDFKVNKKGYVAKKINILQEYKSDMETTQKNYIINKFLNDIYGLSDIDRLAFIKNPSKQTIKRFSTDEETKKRLMDKFDSLSDSYITLKDNGDFIDDMINYFVDNKLDVNISKAIKENVKQSINNYLKDPEYTKDRLLKYLEVNKDKFYDSKNPDNYIKILTYINEKIIPLKDKNEIKEVPTEPKIIKEDDVQEKVLKEFNEIINETIPDKENKVLSNNEFDNKDGFNEAKELLNNNKFTPSNIFKSSHINNYKDAYFGTNSKAYRTLKYLYNKDLINPNDIEVLEDYVKDDNLTVYNIPLKNKLGKLKLTVDKTQYLGDELNKNIGNSEAFKNDIIFEGKNDINDLLKYETKSNKNYNKYDDDYNVFTEDINNEEIQNVINNVNYDITNKEFIDFIEDDYYNKYNKNDKDNKYIKPNKKYEGTYTKYTTNTEANKRLYSILPKELIKPLTPYDVNRMASKYFDFMTKEKKRYDDVKYDFKTYKENITNFTEEKKKYDSLVDTYTNENKILTKKKKKTQNDMKNIKNNKQLIKDNQNLRDEYNQKVINNTISLNNLAEKNDDIILGDDIDNYKINENFKPEYDFYNDKDFKKLEIDEDKQEEYKTMFENYFNDIVDNKFYYTTDDKIVDYTNRTKNKPLNQQSVNKEMLDYYKYNKYRYDKDIKPIKDLIGNGSWSYNVLKRIDELNKSLHKSAGSWSYNVLKRIDELNKLLDN